MTASWILTVGTGLVLAIPVAERVRRRQLDPFEPLYLFVLAYGVMFVARPAAMLVDDDLSFWGVDLRGTMPVATLLAFVGAIGFLCGYELGLGPALARRVSAPRALDARAGLVAASAVAIIGLVVLVVFLPASDPARSLDILLGGRGPDLGAVLTRSSTYLWYGSWLFVPAGLALAGLALRYRRPELWLTAAVVLGLVAIRTIPVGSRIALLPMIGGLFVLAYLVRGRRPSLRTLSMLAVVALFASYALTVLRDPSDRDDYRDSARILLHRPDALFYPLLRGEDAEMMDALAGALTAVPDELGYRYGRATVGDLLVRPIPRELWSGKPLPGHEQIVKHVWPDVYPYLNPTFSPLLALYWDFGIAGAALGMGLFGLLSRGLYAWFIPRRDEFPAQLLFAPAVWFVVIAARNDPVDTVVYGTYLLRPLVAIVYASAEGGRLSRMLGRSRVGDAEVAQPRAQTQDALRR